jgi:predicted small integral membrane protein
MARILKAILALAVIGTAALAVYSYVGDMAPDQAPVSHPVVLDVQ